MGMGSTDSTPSPLIHQATGLKEWLEKTILRGEVFIGGRWDIQWLEHIGRAGTRLSSPRPHSYTNLASHQNTIHS
jgi:hypothetical protein